MVKRIAQHLQCIAKFLMTVSCRNILLFEYHRGDVLAVVGAGVVIGFGGGLLGGACPATDLLRFDIISTFFLRAARRVRMLATTVVIVSAE